MAVELNHIIVPATEKRRSAEFLGHILGLSPGAPWGHFIPLQMSNGVTLDFIDDADVRPQHYAFLVSDAEFDAALERVRKLGIEIYAEPSRAGRGQINHHFGGRGFYFDDPDGHFLELITRPYGASPTG